MSCVGSQRATLLLFGGFSSSGEWLNDIHMLDTSFRQPFYPVNPSGLPQSSSATVEPQVC
jgi:hypothetical protein